MEKKNVLVVYFSATGTTKHAAEVLTRIAGVDLCEIVPAQPYTCLLYTSPSPRD